MTRTHNVLLPSAAALLLIGCQPNETASPASVAKPARGASATFRLDVDPAARSVKITPLTGASAQGLHVPVTVVQDGLPSGPPGTFQAVTLDARLPGEGTCPLGQNCFDVRIDSFLNRAAVDVTLVVEQVNPVRVMSNPDMPPPGSGLSSPFGLINFGTIPANGSSPVRELRFAIADLTSYSALLSLHEEDPGVVVAATCADLLTNQPQYGVAATGVDLSAYTGGTLQFIGCYSNGCTPAQFFCNYDAMTETLSFGSTGTSRLRAVVDPGNARGNAVPAGPIQNCAGSVTDNFDNGIYNAPDANNGGFPGNVADALCNALGYQNGALTHVNANTCPKPHTLNAQGTNWDSANVNVAGYAQNYTCTTFF